MAEITPILQHFQDFLTGKVPFDQIPKIHEDDQYYEDPLECKTISGRPQGAKNKSKNPNRREPSRFKIIERREEEDPSQKRPVQQHQDHSQMSPLQLWKWTNMKILKILRTHYLNPSAHQIHYPQKLN
ncbi:hypothetical protein O181_124960 [Austropuccinia psidii MF-1]|uniref:Uncharacterized protein n=1 Tax=Austropuccinia psidii MF-1 TaxID=1389203 RepID=A0A9Q3Q5N1_9BASI|nr:hypothetical protein [Austropuccinia psidii MF-1]